MVFSSMFFLWVFFPVVFIGSRILPKKFVNFFLLLASLFFYAWGEPIYIVLMVLSICVNYVFALIIDYGKTKLASRALSIIFLIISLLFNLGMLAYFKYFNFISANINAIAGNEIIPAAKIALPIGISFYTFQILSYVIDVYRGKVSKEKNIINLGLYISFFPQLIAGPIVKFVDIQKQLASREVTSEKTFAGIRRFVIGLSKKVLIANICAFTADTIFNSDYSSVGTISCWLGLICYTIQIYYDFSGYSDMAIGLGKIFGFEFLENFNYPYISKSVQEFWRRWHISLSTWFKEYLYIPLGGNRKGKARTYINLFIVFLCTGIWHGASWNFVLWGLWHGLFMILERVFLAEKLEKNRFKVINHIYTLAVVMLGWVIFRADNIGLAFEYIKNMFTFHLGEGTSLIINGAAVSANTGFWQMQYDLTARYINPQLIIILVLAFIFSGVFRYADIEIKPCDMSKKRLWAESAVIIALLAINVLALVSSTYNPFIYFRF